MISHVSVCLLVHREKAQFQTLSDTQNGSVLSISHRRARSPVVMCRSMTAYEPKQEVAAGMGVLPGRERQAAV